MKIVISGGGTGGHIYPALALIKEIKRHEPDSQVLYIGTVRGLEADLVPKEEFLLSPFILPDLSGVCPSRMLKRSFVLLRQPAAPEN